MDGVKSFFRNSEVLSISDEENKTCSGLPFTKQPLSIFKPSVSPLRNLHSFPFQPDSSDDEDGFSFSDDDDSGNKVGDVNIYLLTEYCI